tara:strand:+ start:345 stop:1580 length:1236 start_codon:yes stop_codon:yes gene_type:complete
MARKNGKTNKERQANKAAKREAAKPAPKAASKPKATVGQQISRFTSDGNVDRKEARKLSRSGVSLQDLKVGTAATFDKGATKVFRAAAKENKAEQQAANGAARSAAYKDPTGLGISRKDLFKMQAQTLGGPENWYSQSGRKGSPAGGGMGYDDEQGWYPNEGQINYAMYGGKPYSGQQKTSSGEWSKVQEALGIRTVDKPEDLARMFNFVNGASTGMTRRSSSSDGGDSGLADRSSGDFDDIKGAIGEDSQAGLDAAAELDNRLVEQSSQYQTIIDGLMAQQATQQSSFDSALAAQSAESAASLGQLNDLFTAQYAGLESQMAAQQQDFNNAQAFTNQQLQAANNAFLAEQQRSANLGNAYIPQANPTAMSIGYGDGRTTRRKQDDNQLSDLTLMSGLGTQSNPLAGLQLA